MDQNEIESFPLEVTKKLNYYVYRLIDPRNGETFYVGKGRDNRVFTHIHIKQDLMGDDLDNKVKRIRQIRLSGFEVAHVIHRHGMDEKTAFEVEAALIDAYPGLTNVVGGTGSNDFGVRHARQIIDLYRAEVAVFTHKALLISVNRTTTESNSLYEATRFAWKISKPKAQQAEIILSTMQGLIIGAFIANDWMEATSENFPGQTSISGRFGFVGHEAPANIREQYLGKRIPDEFRKRGSSNPVKYTWKRV